MSSYKKSSNCAILSIHQLLPEKGQRRIPSVDGYNIIFAMAVTEGLADAESVAAQTKLMDILSNYQGYKICTLILVIDAYKVGRPPGRGSDLSQHSCGLYQEAETADQYIRNGPQDRQTASGDQ